MAERWRAFHKFYAGHEPSWGAAKVTEVTKQQLSLCGRDDQQFGELLSKLTSRYGVPPTRPARVPGGRRARDYHSKYSCRSLYVNVGR